MKLEFKQLKPGWLKSVQAQPEQQLEQIGMILPAYEAWLIDGRAEAAWDGPRIVAAAGLIWLSSDVAGAWCLLSPRAGRYMTSITRRCRAVMDADPTRRIEMYVNADMHERGGRWAKAMGFECETPNPLRKRGIGGHDQYIYARVR